MKLNQSKLNRQSSIIDAWWKVNAIGAFEAVTGFGKTFVILLMIKRMTDKFPTYRSTIVVPSTQLKEDWERQVKAMNLPNVTVYVVNTYVKLKPGSPELETELLAADELHHYCSADAMFFNKVLPATKYKYFIGASATLEAEEITFLKNCGIPLFDSIGVEEAEKNGWIAPSIVYNLMLPFSEDDKKYSADLDRKFKSNFSKFDHNFSLMMACTGGNKRIKANIQGVDYWRTGVEWREWWASNMGWAFGMPDDHAWAPKMIIRYAMLGTRSMKERKEFLYNLPSKIDVALALIDKYKDKRMIIFCESQAAADKLEELRPDVVKSYHSNLSTILIDGKKFGKKKRRDLIIKQFESNENACRVIACVKALDEGFNVESIEIAVFHSYTSKRRRDTQRRGRASRIDYDNLNKKALHVNFVMEGSQEVKWVKSKQKGLKKVIAVTSIDDIIWEERKISLV